MPDRHAQDDAVRALDVDQAESSGIDCAGVGIVAQRLEPVGAYGADAFHQPEARTAGMLETSDLAATDRRRPQTDQAITRAEGREHRFLGHHEAFQRPHRRAV